MANQNPFRECFTSKHLALLWNEGESETTRCASL